jgi:hypothetical protein
MIHTQLCFIALIIFKDWVLHQIGSGHERHGQEFNNVIYLVFMYKYVYKTGYTVAQWYCDGLHTWGHGFDSQCCLLVCHPSVACSMWDQYQS